MASQKVITATAAGGTGIIGYIIGGIKSPEWGKIIDGLFLLADKYGPFVIFSFILVGTLVGTGAWLMKHVINGKDAEIERLVEERNRFQAIILNERQSTNRRGNRRE